MNEQPTAQVPEAEPGVEATYGSAVMAGLTPLGQQYLDETRPWVRFISIVTFVMAGIMVLVGIAVLLVAVLGGLAARGHSALGPIGGAIGGSVVALLYMALAFLYVAPGVYLFRYASAITRLKAHASPGGLEDALRHQKSFWRFVGIMAAIGLVLAVVGLILGAMVGVIAAIMAARA